MSMRSPSLSLATLYAEQDDPIPVEPPITSDRPRWNLPDYDRLKATDLKHELMLGRVRYDSGRRKLSANTHHSLHT